MKINHLILALVCVSLWGLNFPLLKIVIQELPALFSCAIRLFIIGIGGSFFISMPKKQIKMLSLLSVTLFTLTLAPTTIALKSVDAAIAALITELEVPFAALISFLLLGEWLSPKKALGLIISFLGIYFISQSPEIPQNNYTSLFLLIMSAFFYGLSAVIIKFINSSSSFAITTWTAMLSAPQVLLLSLIFEYKEILMISTVSYTCLLALLASAAISFFAFFLWNYLIGIYPVNQIVPFGMLIPISSLIASYYLLGETTHKMALIGGLITLLGVWLQISQTSHD